MPANPQMTLIRTNNLQARNPEDLRFKAVRLPGGVSYPAGQVLGERNIARRSEVQTITITATGGTMAVGLDGQNTSQFAYNATSTTTIQALMDSLIGSGNVVVTGSAAGPYTFTFASEYGNRDVAMLTLDTSNLTGGSATIAETTKGSAGPTGTMAAYNVAATDGTQIAKAVLFQNGQTNAKGEMVDQFGTRASSLTAQAAYQGEFPVSALTGLNTLNYTQLGKLVDGGLDTAAGVNEVQTVAVDTILSGGSISLSAVDSTGVKHDVKVAYNTSWTQTVADIQTALIAKLGTSAVACAVTNTHDMTVTWSGTGYAGTSPALLGVNIASATGPTKADVTRTTQGYSTAFLAGSVIKLGV